MRAYLFALSLLGMLPVTATAAEPAQAAKVCVTDKTTGKQIISPKLLIRYYFTADGVDEDFVFQRGEYLSDKDVSVAQLDEPARPLTDPQLCTRHDNNPDAAKYKGDCKNYSTAIADLAAFADQINTHGLPFRSEDGKDVDYRALASGNAQTVDCLASDDKPATAQIAAKPNFSLPFLVRGSADGLYLNDDTDRTSADFKALPKAAVTSAWDGSTGKTQTKTIVFLAYPFKTTPGTGAFGETQIVPYVGVNDTGSIAKNKTRSTSTDTVEFGVSFALLGGPSPKASETLAENEKLDPWRYPIQWITIRPDYLVDYVNKNRLVTANLAWVPTVLGHVNSFATLRPENPFVDYAFVFELRQDNGWYVVRGPGNAKDFNRIGAKVGFVVKSDNPAVPLTFTVNDTILYGLRGTPKHFDDTYADLAWSLDPDNYFALELTYTNGRKEYTGALDRTWNIGLTAKY